MSPAGPVETFPPDLVPPEVIPDDLDITLKPGVRPPNIRALTPEELAERRKNHASEWDYYETLRRERRDLRRDTQAEKRARMGEFRGWCGRVGVGIPPHHVYAMFDLAGEPLYVGVTANLHQRLRQHYDKEWVGRDVARVLTWPFECPDAAREKEREMIRDLRPLHNIVGKKGDS